MKEKVGFIAIGQAGGNIGKLLEQKGFGVFYMNTSKEDLQTLKNVKHTYHITGGEGCNKDRKKAKQLISEDFENVSTQIYEKLKGVTMIFVVFASGGGTGSGCGPMLTDLLLADIEEENSSFQSVGVITVLPGPQESIKAHINSYECFEELSNIEGMAATFIIDNAKATKDHLSLNAPFVNMFYNFIQVPVHHSDRRGNIDKAEIEETLKARGMAIITEIPVKSSGTATVIESFKENIFAPMEPDRTVKYISISIAGNVDVTELEKETGVPLDIFQTYNEKSTICCLSGLSYPMERFNNIYQKVTENQAQILKNLESTGNTKDFMKKGVNFLDTNTKKEEKKPEKPSRRDLMKKYMNS